MKTLATIAAAALALALGACSSSTPRVVTNADVEDTITLRQGMASQVEIPDGMHSVDARPGDPSIVGVEAHDGVVTLTPKAGGTTNLFVRARDKGGRSKVFQYIVNVPTR